MVDERQEQCGVCACGFVWVAGAFFCKSCGRPLYAAAFAPSSIPGRSLTLGCECSLFIWSLKVQLCGCRERIGPLYFTDGGCTAARLGVFHGVYIHDR